jgi:hypothetical protein
LTCWGFDYFGEVGDGKAGSGANSTSPVLSTLTDVAFVVEQDHDVVEQDHDVFLADASLR